YSKYHLHRRFTETVGLTIHDYVQRRQLTEAAKLLAFTRKPILEIALAAGYSSQQSFAGAFKEMYKQAPLEFRKSRSYYPLQLKYEFGMPSPMVENQDGSVTLRYADMRDIQSWMKLVRLVVDGFPCLSETEYVRVLENCIQRKCAFLAEEENQTVGIMLLSYETGRIEFLGVHPLYRKKRVFEGLVDRALSELILHDPITITTYREGDRADTGYRKLLMELGFKEGELLTEFGYPTQKMILANNRKKDLTSAGNAEEYLGKTAGTSQVSDGNSGVSTGNSKKTAAYSEEYENLDKVIEKLNLAWKRYQQSVLRYDREYVELKRYIAEYRSEIDPKEIFQNELALQQIDRAVGFAVKMRNKVDTMKASPYFGRIDFRSDGEEHDAPYYIGRFSFVDPEEQNVLIYDWRAPVSNLFYDTETGRAGYDAPSGRIEGELSLKRQFKISKGSMEYVLESSVNIRDEVLQRELSDSTNEKMKTIIATIQREQNQIIRKEQTGDMVIQGVAGSGKTSVALHRIAYLLYRNRDTLAAENITILSPNKVFSSYISNVLPELGEEAICEKSAADIAAEQLGSALGFELDKDPLENDDTAWALRVRRKASMEFFQQVEQYLKTESLKWFEPRDYAFGGFYVKKEWIFERFQAYSRYPVKRRLKEVADDIRVRLESDNLWGVVLPKIGMIEKELAAMLKVKNSLELYKAFFQGENLSNLLVMPTKKTLEWNDVFPYLYFKSAFEGLKEDHRMKHLVIDEMQDYTPVQLAVIKQLFHCGKTILGDFGQGLNPCSSHTFKDVGAIFSEGVFIELNKSYRSTYEIMTLAAKIQGASNMEPVERHGEPPEFVPCSSEQEELEHIRHKLSTFRKRGSGTLAIITKTNNSAKALYESFFEEFEMTLLTPDSEKFSTGVTVTSVSMAKGLEFEEVIIPSADSITYCTETDRKLLYVACTRAMHKLSLLFSDQASTFLTC
ncbi:MAG: hypothetical protein K0Q48_2062, partial [Bacillota bacterium]|nr:hypothetical protein [Bacillota bacterium]